MHCKVTAMTHSAVQYQSNILSITATSMYTVFTRDGHGTLFPDAQWCKSMRISAFPHIFANIRAYMRIYPHHSAVATTTWPSLVCTVQYSAMPPARISVLSLTRKLISYKRAFFALIQNTLYILAYLSPLPIVFWHPWPSPLIHPYKRIWRGRFVFHRSFP